MNYTVSFLPTKEDYVEFIGCAAYINVNHKQKLFSVILGSLLILMGFISKFLGGGNYGEMGIMVVFGIFLCLYFLVFYPTFIKFRAIQYFDHHGEKMNAVSFIFQEENFSIVSDRYEAKNISYDMIYKTAENEKVFLILLGETDIRYIPKRVFSKEEYRQLKNKLQTMGKCCGME